MKKRALSTAISTFLATSATLWTAAHLFRRAARSSLFAMEDDMGLLDGILDGVIGANALSLVKDYIEKRGGIQGVVAEFEKTGFGQQAKSWVSTGPNLPINAEQIQQALCRGLGRPGCSSVGRSGTTPLASMEPRSRVRARASQRLSRRPTS